MEVARILFSWFSLALTVLDVYSDIALAVSLISQYAENIHTSHGGMNESFIEICKDHVKKVLENK